MTGLVNNNNNILNQPIDLVNANNGVNPAPYQAQNDSMRLRETFDNFEVFNLDDEIFHNTDTNFTPSASLTKKLANIETLIGRAVDSGRTDVTLDQLFSYASSFSETKTGGSEKIIFNNGDEAREIDACVARNTNLLLGAYCFKGNATEAQKTLRSELEALIQKIMSGKYQPRETEQMQQKLNNLTDRLTADIAARDVNQMSQQEKQKATAFAAEVKAKFSRILDNQASIKEQLRFLRSLTETGRLANKIQLTSAKDLIGMGHIITADCEEVSKAFSIPEDDFESVLGQIETGEKDLANAVSERPNLNAGLQAFSRETKEEITGEIRELMEKNKSAVKKFEETCDKIQHLRETGGSANKISIENDKKELLIADSMESIRQIMHLSNRCASQLTREDSEALFYRNEYRPESLVKKELELLKSYCRKMEPAQDAATAVANIDKLMRPENFAMTMNLIRETGFSTSIIKDILKNDSIVDLMIDLKNGANLTNEQLREKICMLSNQLCDGDLYSDNTLLSAVVRSIPQDALGDRAKVIIDHLPVTLNLIADSLVCIDHVKKAANNQLAGNEPLKPASVDFNDLKNAYQKVCHPDRELKKFLSKQKFDADLKNVETVLLRAAYHQYIVEHPEDPDNRKSFREHTGFKNAIGILDHDDNRNDTVGIGRYKNYDPMTINVKNTDMGFFLKGFNLMMHSSDFVDGCKKLPSVHLAERFGESLSVNMKEYLNNNPALKNEFNNLRTHQERIEWMERHQKDLTEQFIHDNTLSLDQIKRHNEEDLRNNAELMKEAKIQKLLDFTNHVTTMVGAEPNAAQFSSADKLLGNLSMVKGSESLAYLASAVNYIATTGIQSALMGQSFLNLKADDFLDINNLGKIKNALKNASLEEKGTIQYKFAVLSYARMLKAEISNQGITSHTKLDGIRVGTADIQNALLSIFPQQAPVQPGDVQGQQLRDANLNLRHDIRNFCIAQTRLDTYGRMRLLENLSLSSSMFSSDDNIFVSSKDEGKAKRKNIEKMLSGAVKELKDRNAPVNSILYSLKLNFNAQLAGNRTADLANSVLLLSPFMAKEFNSKNLAPMDAISDGFTGVFTSSHGRRLDAAKDIMMRNFRSHLSANTSRMSHFMDQLGAKQRTDADNALNLLRNNKLCQILLEKSMRKVAYENKFSTLADMEYSFAHDKGSATKSKADLVNEVVKNMQKEINVDSSVLYKMVLGSIGSDLYLKNRNSSVLSSLGGNLRYAGRAIRGSSFAGHFISIGSAIKNKFTVFRDHRSTVRNFDHISTNVLLSLKPGESVVHTKDNKFQIGAGVDVLKFRKKTLKAGGTFDFMANSKFAVKRNADNSYTFNINAGLAAGLSATGAIAGSATVEGHLGKTGGCSVTFKKESEAIDFMSKVLAAAVRQEDFENGADIKRISSSSAKIGANVTGNVFLLKDVVNDELTSKQPATVTLSAGASLQKNWSHEINSNSHKFSKQTQVNAGINFKASYSLFGHIVGYGDSSELSDAEKEEYQKNSAVNKKVDNILKYAMDHKGAISKILTSSFVDEYAEHKLSNSYEKNKWKGLSTYNKYQTDPKRVLGELVLDQFKSHVVSPALKDLDTFTSFIGSKIPGIKNIPELKKNIAEFFDSLKAKLDSSNTRFDAGLDVKADTSDLVSVHAGVNYSTDTVTSFETNLLQNQLLSAEKVTTIKPESKGSKEIVMTNNIKFLSASMKELGCTEEQINKAVKKLHQLQSEKKSAITGFQIVRSAKNEALVNVRKSVKQTKNLTDQFKNKVDSLKEKDFYPVKIVFNTLEKKVHSSSFELGGSYLVTANLSSKENMNVNNSYTVNL